MLTIAHWRFDPPDLKLKLSNSTEAELRSLQSSLRSAKEETATDLQKNVFKKYIFLSWFRPASLLLTQA